MSSFLPTLAERRSPWVTSISAADRCVAGAGAEAELRAQGGIVLRLDGEELRSRTARSASCRLPSGDGIGEERPH